MRSSLSKQTFLAMCVHLELLLPETTELPRNLDEGAGYCISFPEKLIMIGSATVVQGD